MGKSRRRKEERRFPDSASHLVEKVDPKKFLAVCAFVMDHYGEPLPENAITWVGYAILQFFPDEQNYLAARMRYTALTLILPDSRLAPWTEDGAARDVLIEAAAVVPLKLPRFAFRIEDLLREARRRNFARAADQRR